MNPSGNASQTQLAAHYPRQFRFRTPVKSGGPCGSEGGSGLPQNSFWGHYFSYVAFLSLQDSARRPREATIAA